MSKAVTTDGNLSRLAVGAITRLNQSHFQQPYADSISSYSHVVVNEKAPLSEYQSQSESVSDSSID